MTPNEMFSVKGYAAIVTGGASGIGYAISEVLAENGAIVTIIDRNAAALAEVVESFGKRGFKVRGAVADVCDEAQMRGAFEAAHDAVGRLDAVFVNAGIGIGAGFMGPGGVFNQGLEFENYDLSLWDMTMAINLKGAVITMREAARIMKRHGSGRIIVTSSVASVNTPPTVGFPYPVSKAAVAHLVRCAALELVNYGILVNAIAPGTFKTAIAGGRLLDPAVEAKTGPGIPIGRFGRTDEIKGLALFLASPASSYMVGSQVLIDGGMHMGRLERPK